MKDRLQKKVTDVTVQSVLGTIKERLIEYKFNIDVFDIKDGMLKARRNTLDKMVMGLYRNVEVNVSKDEREGKLLIELDWGGLFFSNMLTFLIVFLISYALLKGEGAVGLLISVPVGLLFVLVNLTLFYVLRARIISLMKKDIKVLDREGRKKKGRGP